LCDNYASTTDGMGRVINTSHVIVKHVERERERERESCGKVRCADAIGQKHVASQSRASCS